MKKMKVTVMKALTVALMLFSATVLADPSVVIEKPLDGESVGFVSVIDGFTLPLQIAASDEDFNNSDGFAVKVESGGRTLYDKPDILFRKDIPTDLEINEGYSYDPANLYQTATITVRTPDGRVTTSTFVFGVLPYGGVLVHDLDEINTAIDNAKEWESYPLVLIKTNSIPLVSGDTIALPTPDEYVNVYFGALNPEKDLFDVSAIVPTFGTPYDVVTNFATNNFVEMRWEWDEAAGEDVQVPRFLTTIDEQLAHFVGTNGVSKIVYDDKRRTISLVARGESEDFPWILDAATNVTAWVDAESSNLVIDNGLPEKTYEIDLVALTNGFARYGYTAPSNALVKVVGQGTPSHKIPAGWVGAGGGMYTTLADALAAGETAVLPGYRVGYDGNGAAGVMSNDVFAVNREVSLTANAYSALGYTFAGWTTGTNTAFYTDAQVGTNFADVSETLVLTAQWTQVTNGVTATTFAEFTNMLVQAGRQDATLPVAIGFTSGVTIPEGAAVSLPDPPGGLTKLSYADGETALWREDGTLYGVPLCGEVPVDALAIMNLTKVGTNDAFKAVKVGAAGTNEAYDVVMLLGDDGVPYDSVAAVLAADPRPTTVRLFDVVGYRVSYDGNGAAGEMPTDMFVPTVPTNLTANAFTAVGYAFAGWMTNEVEEVAYADGAAGVDFAPPGETLALTAKWTDTGVSVGTFDALTNVLVTATNQTAALPVTLTLTDAVAIPQGGVVTVYAGPAIAFAGEGVFDVSGIVPQFGAPVVVGEGFADASALALFDTKGVSKLVFDEGTISLVARGEATGFPWILDAATNVTAWVDADTSNLVIDNGLPGSAYGIDPVALTNGIATYGYTPASPFNATVKVVDGGETSYKTPTCWIGGNGSYETLGAALEAGETAVLPGYEVTYGANGASGEMTADSFAAGVEVALKENAYAALGYGFAGWTTNGADAVAYADGATGKDFAPVDGALVLTAKWAPDENGVKAADFDSLTNMIDQAARQSDSLPVTIGFTSGVRIPEGAVVTLPSGTGFNGLTYEDGTTLWLADGVLYGDPLRGEVTVDALVLMQTANGGTIPPFKALSEGEDGATVTNDVVMLLGDDGVPYDSIGAVLAADPRPATVKVFEGDGYYVSYDGNGAAGEMADDKFIPTLSTNLTANAFTAVGHAFAGWTTNGVGEVAYADGAAGVDFADVNGTLALVAKWTETGVTVATFDVLTNALVTATNQAASLPVTLTLTGAVSVPEDGVVTVCDGPAVSFAGEGVLDVSGIVPQFGAPVVVGEGFADASALALFDTKGVSLPVFDEGTISLVARGETADFPWILDAETNVTAWVDLTLTNLAAVVVDNGLSASCAEIDLVALADNLALYGYTPAMTPLNALVKVVEDGETTYRIPTGWIGAEETYATLEAALAAGETAVVPNFATGEIPTVIAENAMGADGLVYTAVVANDPGEVENAIRAVFAEGLLARATNEQTNVRLVVSAQSVTDVADEEEKIVSAMTNDVEAVAGLVADYVDLSVFFGDVPQTTLAETVGVCIPRTVDPQHDYVVVRLHDGVAEKLPVGEENAVEGEYVEFAADGLVIHTKKFSLYAIGEITPFVTVTVPTGLEGFAYVVSNLTAGVEMAFDSSVDGGVAYKLPVDAKVSITCVPEAGYVVDGEATYVIDPVTKETTLPDGALSVAREDNLLYPKGDGGRFVPATKLVATFNGTFFGEDGVEGLITLKMTKPNRFTGLFNVQATVKTLVDKMTYVFRATKVASPKEGVLTLELPGRVKKNEGHKLVVILDGDSLTGSFDGFAIDGARDVFGIRNHPKREALAPLVGTWTGAFAGEDGESVGAAFSLKILKSARTSVKVVDADGKTTVCSSKVEIGMDGRGVVPVTVSRRTRGVRTSVGFRVFFRPGVEALDVKAVNVTPVRQWSPKSGVESVRELAFFRAEELTVTPRDFRTSYVLKLSPTYDEVLGPIVRKTLRLDSFGRITGTVAWKAAYRDARGRERVKSVSGKVTGVMVGEVGYGTVAVKLPTGEKASIGLEFQKE